MSSLEPSRKRPRQADDSANDEKQSGGASHQANDDAASSPELKDVDFTKRISWGKYKPYNDTPLPLVPEGTPPIFDENQSPALCCQINAVSGRARAITIHLCNQPGQETKDPRPIPTPIFMPVGTKGCLKGVEISELISDPALSCPIILANTYHLAIQPGTELVDEMGGLHSFQGLPNACPLAKDQSYSLLTDSGGFQMVSLVKLSKVTEDGVSFENPFTKSKSTDGKGEKDMLLLRPEDSIRHQNNISANIIMALDDVVSSVEVNDERFQVATHRTLRWYDRCHKAHAKAQTQNLFPIVQGGLDTKLGGLREQCLAGFRHRAQDWNYRIPGYAIGGLAGGESKDDFWRVVDQCCRALPDNKPRYLMGVGYPLDLVVCSALGVDMYDCVYPTRTARFGVALVPGEAPGTLRLKSRDCACSDQVIQEGCGCQACRGGVTRARLHTLLKANNPLAVQLISQHNVAYMMFLVRSMRRAIFEDKYGNFAKSFVREQYPEKDGKNTCPQWIVDALDAAGIHLAG